MAEIQEILVLHHSHFDVGYTHPQPVVWELQSDYMHQVLDLCERTADWAEESRFRWTWEVTAPVVKWLETADGPSRDRFTHFVRNGQIDLAAAYAHGTPLCNAEQLTRMLYPVLELRKEFGVALDVCIHHDVNGQPWPYTQILLDAGIRFFMMGINTHFGGIPLTRPLAFRWRAPDGRDLLTFSGEHYSRFTQITRPWTGDTNVMAEGLQAYLNSLREREYSLDFVYLTATNFPMYDNTPPDYELAVMIRKWNEEGRQPRIRFVTPGMLRERVEAIPSSQIHSHAGDWTDYWNFGSASSAVETAVNRHTKTRLAAVEFTEAALGGLRERDAGSKRRVWESAFLYDEHTWGANESITRPDSPMTRVQWAHKAHYAYEAESLCSYLLGSSLERLAGNPPQSPTGAPGAVLLVNPTSASWRREVVLPPSLLGEKDRQVTAGRMQGCPDVDHSSGEQVYGPVELAPFSWRVIPLRELVAVSPSDSIQVTENTMETPHHRLTFDPATGRVTSLYDKRLKWEVIDGQSEWTFFQFVRETIDPLRGRSARMTLFRHDGEPAQRGWNAQWPARREGASRLSACEVVRLPHAVALILRWEAPGVRDLTQRITLFADRPEIELSASFDKLDVREPEALYFAFPLNLGDWRAAYDSAGMFIELDAEQLPGSCRDWVTADQTVSVWDADKGAALACPDAPMLQIGGFHFGQQNRALRRDRPPLLLSWPLNNYWDTNFRASQPGHVALRYEFTTFREFDPVAAAHFGIAAQRPVEIWPVATEVSTPVSRTLLEFCGEGALPAYVKAAEDGRGLIVRLRNHLDRPVQIGLRTETRELRTAILTSTLEEDRQSIAIENGWATVPLEARGLASVRLL